MEILKDGEQTTARVLSDVIHNYTNKMIVYKKWSKTTENGTMWHINNFLSFCPAGITLEQITEEIIDNYLGKVGAGRTGKPAPYQMAYSHRVLKAFFNWCVEKQYLKYSPVPKDIGKPKERIHAIPSHKELLLILATFDNDTFTGKRNRAILLFFINTGCRISEVLCNPENGTDGIQINDVNIRQGFVKVLGKGNKERIVPIHGPTARAFIDYTEAANDLFAVRKSTAFFITAENEPLETRGFATVLTRTCRVLKMDYTAHDFRRLFCTTALENGMDAELVRKISGHESAASMKPYIKNLKAQSAFAELEKHSPVAGL